MTTRPRRIRWDIVEEHLDEAGFLRQLWEEALRSPAFSLPEIAEGPEARMLAHLDGLVAAGQPAAKRVLLPALVEGEPDIAFAAAYALLASEEGDFAGVVLREVGAAEPGQRAAIRRAVSISPRADLDGRLASAAREAATPAVQADLLSILGERRVDPGLGLETLAGADRAEDLALALRLAGLWPGRLDPIAVERGLSAQEEAVRAAALTSAMVLGGRGAFAAAEATVAERGPAFATAALLLGLSGDERCLGPLLEALGDAGTRGAAAYALGHSGWVEAADALLSAMREDEALAPLAAEGFAAITGLPVEKQFARPPKRWDPQAEAPEGEAAEPYGPEADLPRPEPEAAAAWWREARPRLDAGRRWLRGQPWAAESVLRELAAGPARRREALAVDLAIRSRGQVQLCWDGLSARQARQMSEAREVASARLWTKTYRDLSGR